MDSIDRKKNTRWLVQARRSRVATSWRKKLDALATPDSAPSGLSGIPDKLLVMSETVMNGSVEAFFQRRGLATISCSVCVALSEAGYRQARRKAELRLASSSVGARVTLHYENVSAE